MSLVGNLEDLGLGEILQIVSLSRKSGILRIRSRGREGTLFFRQGQVIQAASSSRRESIGEFLIRRGAIDPAKLRGALDLQAREGGRERLGAILVRYFDVLPSVIEEAVREQIEDVVYALFGWIEGTFDFELQEMGEASDAALMDPMQFMLDQGLSPQYLLTEQARPGGEGRGGAHSAAADEPVAAGTQQQRAVRPVVPPDEPDSFCAPSVERPHLVVVDDDESTRDFLAEILERDGYRVHLLAGSDEALARIEALRQRGEDPLLLVDLIMPRMDGSGILGGLELLEQAQCRFPHLRTLVMTDFLNGDAERRLGERGCSPLMKPRRGGWDDETAWEEFSALLRSELARLRDCGGAVAPGELVDLGDLLRQELGDVPVSAAGRPEPSSGMTLLHGMLRELNDPSLGGGITLLVLRYAAEFVNRAVLFMVQGDELVGLGQFGILDRQGSADARIRKLRIPRTEASLFSGVMEAKHPAVLRPEPLGWNSFLFGQLDDGIPDEVFVGPIVSEGKVVALLYGDNLPGKKSIGGTESLEIFLSQAGVAMEKALLERKLMENSRGRP